MPAALDENQFGTGNFLRQHLGGLDVAAGAAFVGIFTADDDQCRRFDVVNQMSRLVTLPRHHMAQITFLRRHFVKKYQELIVDEVPPLKCYLRHVVARQCHETTHLIHNIKAPTLVIVGSKDTHEGGTGSHVESAKVLAQKIPGAELVLVEGGRHGYLREMPEKGHPPILDFLRRH